MGFKEKEIIRKNKDHVILEKLKKINEYTKDLTKHENPQLQKIYEEEATKNKLSPTIEPEIGRFLNFYIRSLNYKRVLELGTGIGYSTIWLGEALYFTGGNLVSVEENKNIYQIANENINRAGLGSVVDLKNKDALDYIHSLINNKQERKFEFVFIDLNKTVYPKIIESCIEITKQRGIIVADDTLFKPKGLRSKVSEPVHQYNKFVFSDRRLYSTILPVGDGLTMSLKL